MGTYTGHAGEQSRARPLVLVVEDERHDWKIYGKILWYNGFDTAHAADGAEGLELARRRRPDLVLLDIGLPKMNGFELCGRLRDEPETTDIPLIAISGRREREYGGRARAAGCMRYLEKPVGPMKVLREVERVVGRPPPAGVGHPPQNQPAASD